MTTTDLAQPTAGDDGDLDSPPTSDADRAAAPGRPGWYLPGLIGVALAGLVVRVISILVVRPTCQEDIVALIEQGGAGDFTPTGGKDACFGIWGDTAYGYIQGRMIGRGNWFIDSFSWFTSSGTVFKPSSGDPPLFALFLGFLSRIGLETGTEQRLACAVLGVSAIVLIATLTTKLAGPRAGIIAGLIAAVYPMLWINDGMLLSESLYVPMILLALHAAYRFWDRPTVGHAALFGAAMALAALTRAEALILFGAMALPLLWGLRRLGAKRIVTLGAVMAVVGVVLIGPWLAYNLTRFQNPALMTSATGAVLSSASCDVTYYGDSIGYYGNCFDEYVQRGWMLGKIPTCDEAAVQEAIADPKSAGAARCWPNDPALDETERDKFSSELALRYIRENKRRLPIVMAARVGRMWDLYVPELGNDVEPLGQNVRFNWQVEGRGKLESETGVLAFYALWPFAIIGTVWLWRRRIPISPFVSMAVVITVTAALTFGITRYRVPIDVVMVVLGAVGIEALLRRRWPGMPGPTVLRPRPEHGGATAPADASSDTAPDEPARPPVTASKAPA